MGRLWIEAAPGTAARVRRARLSSRLLAPDELAEAEAELTWLGLLFAT